MKRVCGAHRGSFRDQAGGGDLTSTNIPLARTQWRGPPSCKGGWKMESSCTPRSKLKQVLWNQIILSLSQFSITVGILASNLKMSIINPQVKYSFEFAVTTVYFILVPRENLEIPCRPSIYKPCADSWHNVYHLISWEVAEQVHWFLHLTTEEAEAGVTLDSGIFFAHDPTLSVPMRTWAMEGIPLPLWSLMLELWFSNGDKFAPPRRWLAMSGDVFGYIWGGATGIRSGGG